MKRMNLSRIFNLASLIVFASLNSFAENSFVASNHNPSCSIALNSIATIHSENSVNTTIPRPASIFIKLLEQTLAEIGAIKSMPLTGDSHALQLRILQLVATSNMPIDPLENLASAPSIAALFNQNYLLKMLISRRAFRMAMANISVMDWHHIKEFSKIEKSAMEDQLQDQTKANNDTEQDFVELAPDLQGRVRLHYLIEQQNFADAIILLNNPKTTTRYVNTRDEANETPLDIFLRIFSTYRQSFEGTLNPTAPPFSSSQKPEIETLIEALKWRSARTANQLVELQIRLIKLIECCDVSSTDVDWTFRQGGDLDFEYKNESALMVAARRGNISVVRDLLFFGVRLNPINGFGETPVYQAVHFGHTEMVKLLAISGADLLKTPPGISLVNLAVKRNHPSTFRALAEFGVSLYNPNMTHPNPVFAIVENTWNIPDVEEFFQLFKEFGLDLNEARSVDGSTPAHSAVRFSNPRNLQALAKHGADLDKQEILGNRPLHYVESLYQDLELPAFVSPNFQTYLEIFYNYYVSMGIPPIERGLQKKINGNIAIYQYKGFPKDVWGAKW